ncbi:MAG: Glycosyl transferase group 1 [Parcubacteria group bacterium GW2011_GWD2_43_10]|uniref:Glycosyl transferase family 1 domain-containing protein n=5 Tax=Candidatus Vebleniibacteriota TaxID=1817921 RepID=A0A1G2Q7D7_9BACT|nr:MAG: Glycosyl transferase group 1 [Parcubacteria group bacterium GW2011_GWA2_42_80]KKS79852.1 MAG: Glycosyl transferase group 1 [Parcubacteria group bacterium GW2011_GWD1_42_9]KKS84007.1 MAG: Glycosyl transferase group 1 [Parcubacteria group bacterium GW2011_GWD2_43_10]KKS93586.1 MAG: Glycosyl transferase group 1 [Parcubacteria group bacterium GW2011_GWE2_43_12]KKT14288.1 MAG: Glycosyl transferase group 1 [Parcubacteria group bacterium GW2011_GWA1_43_27]KKT16102.1 MAG: Glycosyl transferase 
MKVALAHDHLNQIGGAERVLRQFHQLYPDAPVFTLLYDEATVGDYFKNWDIRTSFLERLPGGARWFKWYVWLMPTAVEQIDLSGFDLVISSASALIKGLLVKPETINICYCHTPTRYLWSDTHQYTSDLPQPKLVKKILPLVLNYLRQWDYIASQRVDYFVANSQFVAKRIKKYYGRDSVVIYPPVDTAATDLVEPQDYFLLISRLRPYKRVDLAIKAFNKLGIPLKIIGAGEQEVELRNLAKSNIEFLGQVTDQEKRYYLGHCRALIHPQEEDFGITAVEAMAAGRPVIAYGAGGALETIEPGVSGVFFQEQSWEELADAVIRFRYESFEPEVIRQRAQKFSRANFIDNWQKYVSKVITK